MMKLTVVLLAALAAADAVEARSHRQARRQYHYKNYGYNAQSQYVASSSHEVPVASSYPTPAASSSVMSFPVVSYDSVSSKPPVENQSTMGYPSTIPVVTKSSSQPVEASSSAGPSVPYSTGAVASSSQPAGISSSAGSSVPYSTGAVASSSQPVQASSSAGSSVVYSASGSQSSSASVLASSVVSSSSTYPTGVFPPGGYIYPSGTGVSYTSSTPLTAVVTKTIYSNGKAVGTTVCKESEFPTTPVELTTKTPVSEVVKTLVQTLIYTVGSGTTARALTTEVTSTSTQTIYRTVVVTVTKPEAKPTDDTSAGEQDQDTTTVKSTSTLIKYITVHASKPSSNSPSQPAASVDNNAYPTGPAVPAGSNSPVVPAGSQCAAPVTVTVTAKETVTVTQGYQFSATSVAQNNFQLTSSKSTPVAESTRKHWSKPSAIPSSIYPVGNATYSVGQLYSTSAPTKPTSTPVFSYVSQPYSVETAKPASSSDSAQTGYQPVSVSFVVAKASSSPAAYGATSVSSSAPAQSSLAGYAAVPLPSSKPSYGY